MNISLPVRTVLCKILTCAFIP